jgi:hypothetical protein
VLGFHPEGGGLVVLAIGGLYWVSSRKRIRGGLVSSSLIRFPSETQVYVALWAVPVSS